MKSLELSEDEMVDLLSHLQYLGREVFSAGKAEPYIASNHEKACDALLSKVAWLANQGEVL